MCATTKNERERTYWAANVAPILGDDVEVHGECPHDQKADRLARAAALVFPIQWAVPFFDRVGELDPRVLRSRVEQQFSAEAMVAGYEQAYERALAGERPAG